MCKISFSGICVAKKEFHMGEVKAEVRRGGGLTILEFGGHEG